MNPIQKIKDEQVYAVIRVEEPKKAVTIAKSLEKGGIKTIELMLENADLISALQEIKAETELMVAAGGIITTRQATIAIDSGADIIVSPIVQMNLLRLSNTRGVPLFMTATTPNEAYEAWKARTPLIKIYPTTAMGGAQYIEELLRPMRFLDVIATGNISLEDFTTYFEAGAKAVGIGRAFYQYASPDEITQRAEFALKKLNSYKNKQ